jgi:hypothetical protein
VISLGRAVRFLGGAGIRHIRARTRSRAYAERFFDGFDLADPGRFWGLVGVGHRP